MCSGNLPDPNNRVYYPSLEDIQNHIGEVKQVLLQLSVTDQENAAKQALTPDNALPSTLQDLRLRKNLTVGSTRSLAIVKHGNTMSLMDTTIQPVLVLYQCMYQLWVQCSCRLHCTV